MIEFGLTPQEFRASFLDTQPRLQQGAIRGEPFTWRDLDEVLHRVEPVAPAFQLWNGGPVDEDRYADRLSELGVLRTRLNKRRFFEQLRSGATLVINRFEQYSVQALRLSAEVRRFSGAQSTGNAYLSVGGRGTFGKHWDTHDVFALQLIGRKRWQVFPPTFPLPLGMHRSEGSGETCPPEPALDCVLETGDLLYVPRGWWHHAIPFAEPSLHLSVGTYGPTVHDYVMWACARHLPEVLGARRSLTTSVGRVELDAALQALREIVLGAARRDEYERDVAGFERVATQLHTELFLATGADGLTSGATLSLNTRPSFEAAHREIVVNGSALRLHPLCQSIVATLAATATALPIEALYAKLPRERPEAVRAAVLELALHEVVVIARGGERD